MPKLTSVATIKNGMVYIYMGSETFVDVQDYGDASGNITIGYSTQQTLDRFVTILRLTYAR